MRKGLVVWILIVCMALSACGVPRAEESAGTRTFVDSCGRSVEVPEHITKAAVSGPLSQLVVFALAPELLCGISSDWSDDALRYIPAQYQELPVLGQLYGGTGDLNTETLLRCGAQVVIDVGEEKEGIADDLDRLQEQTGIPFVHIDCSLSTADETYLALGELLDREEEAKTLADYCASVYDRTVKIADSVEKVRLLYLLGDFGTNVIAAGSYHAEVIDLLADNLAVVETPSSKGIGNEVDMEQILLWNPDYILFAPDSVYSLVGDDPTWQKVSAVSEGQYYEVPYGPYNWMGFPPSVQRLLGMIWMAKVLYPEACDYDLHTETVRYFELFYHVELSREQYDTLTANSLGTR
ncbi:MAG: ABC transporter substrate-binding protein [Oscillospiraceae bacterium]|nr:ABC transporter substrate-binding protein [Oscillospiraceae bacterium]